jgi:hypothetical protein
MYYQRYYQREKPSLLDTPLAEFYQRLEPFIIPQQLAQGYELLYTSSPRGLMQLYRRKEESHSRMR